ncbi:proteasome assembly chaperone 2-like [Tubulanus polymorphus]|uniref:proteasome assembly chaperone 2-like n=1 Tax=Tubulanus polymorphus TaxID=672921 RepID=UPI003DA60C94
MFIGKQCGSWKDKTLIIPAVSVGNVGQLAVDVIISTLNAKRIGYIYTNCILPVVGNDPYASKVTDSSCLLMTACEVFEDEQNDLVIMQQRAPFAKGKSQEYREWLLNWIKDIGFKDVIILTSCHSHMRIDQQLFGTQLRHVTSSTFPKEHKEKIMTDLNWKELEEIPPEAGLDHEQSHNYMPGAGIAKKLYESMSQENISALCVLTFCSEGDNVQDAIRLATHLNTWKNLIKDKESAWKIPVSWRLFYGSKSDQTLFQ